MEQQSFFDDNGLIYYDKYIVAFSGGKDSMACFLHLLDLGISKEKIELWHHKIDDPSEPFMDWEITPDYCQKFADAFNVPIYFSWKDGGFMGEMLRNNVKTSATYFVTPDGEIKSAGGKDGKPGTRLKFPQVTPDLSLRWCSTLKIDGMACAIRNQERFNNKKIVVLSGERGEESVARSNYKDLEVDRSDSRFIKTYVKHIKRKIKGEFRLIPTRITIGKADRHVDRWRPVKNWNEERVWEIIKRYKIRVHPCYYMGFSRCSCMFCIFGNAHQFASAALINPSGINKVIGYEDRFGVTIKRKKSLRELISEGIPYQTITKELAEISMSSTYDLQIVMNDDEDWILPSGAFGEGCGPS